MAQNSLSIELRSDSEGESHHGKGTWFRLLFWLCSWHLVPLSPATPSSDTSGSSQDSGRDRGLEEKEPRYKRLYSVIFWLLVTSVMTDIEKLALSCGHICRFSKNRAPFGNCALSLSLIWIVSLAQLWLLSPRWGTTPPSNTPTATLLGSLTLGGSPHRQGCIFFASHMTWGNSCIFHLPVQAAFVSCCHSSGSSASFCLPDSPDRRQLLVFGSGVHSNAWGSILAPPKNSPHAPDLQTSQDGPRNFYS